MEKKRERGKNYTEQEKESLLEIIREYHHVIENKQTDGTTIKLKNDAWEVVTKQFNAMAQTGNRSSSQLRLLYDCMKKKAKKEKANEKVQVYKTGGGSANSQMDSISEKVLGLNSMTATQEISNIYDSDAPLDNLLLNREHGSEVIILEEIENAENSQMLQEIDILDASETQNIAAIERKINARPKPETIASSIGVNNNKPRPGIPYNKAKKDNNSSSEEKENLKLDILRIRKEKEELSRDILKLEKKKLQLDIQERILKLKNDFGRDFDIDTFANNI